MLPFDETPEFTTWFSKLTTMPSTPLSENLYADDALGKIRRANLREYFRRIARTSPDIMIVGEAPGYQGTRRTGVPFGSEDIIMGNMPDATFFKPTEGFNRAFSNRVYKEPTSTIMRRKISKYNRLPLLWAVYPLHPHRLDELESNRTPTHFEVAEYKDYLMELINIVRPKVVLSLGNTAKITLDELGIETRKIRHPSHGGSTIFQQQLDDFMNTHS